MLVKILGLIDAVSAFVFLMIIFGLTPWTHLMVFCVGLLLLKGMFIFSGDMLSIIDLFSAVVLGFSIFFIPGAIFLWIPAFLLLAKAIVSFL